MRKNLRGNFCVNLICSKNLVAKFISFRILVEVLAARQIIVHLMEKNSGGGVVKWPNQNRCACGQGSKKPNYNSKLLVMCAYHLGVKGQSH